MTGHDRSTVDDWVHVPPAELVAAVAVAPAPDMPMASLRALVVPVRDDRGDVVDWRLDAANVIEHEPGATALAEYLDWRRSWVHEWPIGPIGNVVSLLDECAAIDYDDERALDDVLDEIVRTDGAPVTIDGRRVDLVAMELETVRLALSVDDRSGFGIVDDMPLPSRSDGLARTWARPQAEEVVAATPLTSLLLDPDAGLVLVHGQPDSAETFAGIRAVDMRADTVVLLNERGASFRMSQTDARPLGWLVPRSLRWHVREVPLVAVWTTLFHGLGTALHSAAERDLPVRVTSQGPPPPVSGRREFLDR